MVEERMTPGSLDYVELLFHWHRYLLAAHLARGKDVLDLGCGEGYGAHFLARSARKVLAVDIDPATVESATSRYAEENLAFLAGSVTNISCEDSSFDLVVAFEIIEHLEEDDQKKLLTEVRRVLKPGGLFLISTPDKHRTELFEGKNPYHARELYLEEFKSLLGEHFRRVELYMQEINLASFLWPAAGTSAGVMIREHRIKCDASGSRPTGENMSLYLYSVALCSDGEQDIKPDVSGVCHDVNRKPLESIWDRITGWAEKYRGLEKKLESERLYRQGEMQRVEAEKKDLVESISSLHRQNIIMAKEIRRLETELEEIYSSRAWKLVRKYRRTMDHTFWGVFLRPLRDFVVKCARRVRR